MPPPGVRRPARLLAALVAVMLTALLSGPAYAEGPSTPSAAPYAEPTADPGAPTPTAPSKSLPPAGSAPDGSTVGGDGLATRGRAQAVGTPALPAGVRSRAWMIADLDSGAVLAARDPHGRYYPASTLKTLLLDAVYPLLDPKKVVVATAQDVSVEGSATGMVKGGKYSVRQLWLALMLGSDNQAANALARTAGGIAKTLRLMNAKAHQLHAYDTVAGSPSGLDVAGQSSSPYDLCLFMREIVQHAATRRIASQLRAALPAVPPKYGPVQFSNQNKLLYNYPGAIAGKTGFTDAARHTFVAAAQRGKRHLVVSLMNGDQAPVQMWQQAANLLDWGFSTKAGVTGVGTLVKPGDDVTSSPPSSPPASISATAGVAEGAPRPATPSVIASGSVARHSRPLWPILLGLAILAAGAAVGAHRMLARRRH